LAFALLGAASLLAAVEEGESLNTALPRLAKEWELEPQDRGAISALTYFGLRHWGRGRALLQHMTAEMPGPQELRCLLELALALASKRAEDEGPEYSNFTLADQAVNAARSHPQCIHGAGLLNALLRRFWREAAQLMHAISAEPLSRDNCPAWWSKKLHKQYGEQATALLQAQRSAAPMMLRVNERKQNAAAYLEMLHAAGIDAHAVQGAAIRLERGVPVEQLPEFGAGAVSVQDFGAQLAAHLLGAQDGHSVLDACAAPGGKTAHLLERYAVDLTAIDSDPARLSRIKDNLARLGLAADVRLGDATQPLSFQAAHYDRILIDAPCSGSGVARRHPDMLWLRRESDIPALKNTQSAILNALWPHLKVGGRVLYCTCSVFHEEGLDQAKAFLKRTASATAIAIHDLPQGLNLQRLGDEGVFVQLLPQAAHQGIAHDGFFYALFEKLAA
jgi:16S rRNA (cytosine967-C5)-methyltransferase